MDSAGALLTIINDYPLEQHVFVEGSHLGAVPPSSSAAFGVPLGSHTVVCADSPHPGDNPSSFVATFQAGYAYTYRLTGE